MDDDRILVMEKSSEKVCSRRKQLHEKKKIFIDAKKEKRALLAILDV